ncbi:MAG TPA: threonylcarbamoyl-AMP synthase [Methylophilaceae bacterium]|nr:threonylcarbamoyl-AMP synthase [Methylophilaceae bacterium]
MRIHLEQAITMLKQGKVVAIPTETVYGLAADATNDAALKQIYAIKQRPFHNPLIVHIADMHQVTHWAAEFPPLAQKLAKAFWPGPFTLVLPAKPEVSSIVRANEPTVALRVPAHPVTQQVLQQSGLSLAAPSANKYTQLSPTCVEHVEAGLGLDIPVLDGGRCQVGIESTIVSVAGAEWQILRHGMISQSAIEQVAGTEANTSSSNRPKAPGQHLLHYSPQTPTLLFSHREDLIRHADQHADCVALLIGEGKLPACEYITLPLQSSSAAEALYDTLHRLDRLNKSHILIELPPQTDDWAAILDRLSRAGHRTHI